MLQLFQERKAFFNSKKRPQGRAALPQLKNSPTLPKKLQQQALSAQSRLIYNYQPLSNILVSKKICPPSPQQGTMLLAKKRQNGNSNIHNFKIRKQSLRKQNGQIQQGDTFNQNMPKEISIKIQQKIDGGRLSSTSLSQRNKRHLFSLQECIQESRAKTKADQITYCVPKGNNNQQLVRTILARRKNWKQINYGEGIANFKWVPVKQRINYKKLGVFGKLRVANHFQFNNEITTKNQLVHNLQLYCQSRKIQVFNLTPITFQIDFDDQYCEYNIKQFLNFYHKNDPRKGNKKQNINLSKFKSYMSWQNPDIKKKVNLLSRPLNNPIYYSQHSYLWLLKPTGLNRGRGIQIFDSLQNLQKILLQFLHLMNRKKHIDKVQKGQKSQKIQKQSKQKQKQQNQQQLLQKSANGGSPCQSFNLTSCSFVIQKYVEKPLLISNRKFDIRVWVLLTQTMKIHLFKEAYLRTSGQDFSTEDASNYFVHLTNNAIQKYSSNYGQHQNANQLSFKQLDTIMTTEERIEIWQKIKQITFMAFSSVKRKININGRAHCFQIFGLDYIIDSQKKVWLIEVNQNPCIQCSSPLLGKLIPRMVNDAFKITLDPLFGGKSQVHYPVQGYEDDQILWQNLGILQPNCEYSPGRK